MRIFGKKKEKKNIEIGNLLQELIMILMDVEGVNNYINNQSRLNKGGFFVA